MRKHLNNDMDAATLAKGLASRAEEIMAHTSMKWFIRSSLCGRVTTPLEELPTSLLERILSP